MPDFSYESSFDDKIVIGIDEAGRGPVAGPVVAACCLIDKSNYSSNINDSKKISPKKRNKIFNEIKNNSKYGIGIISPSKIDEINILQATKLAMLQSYKDFIKKNKIYPNVILVDGNFIPFDLMDNLQQILPIIKGDQKSVSIAAASIIAKETRDQIMIKYHEDFPNYGFKDHMGYPTKKHLENIEKHGITKLHRKSFAPVKNFIKKQEI